MIFDGDFVMVGVGMLRGCSVRWRMHRWYVTTPTVSNTGGPNEFETTENGRGRPLLLLVGVVVEPPRPADELVDTARSKLHG